jgi:hypothetical protein|tara:strand:- start:117 stop:419 length:303 start_codon:yes stop_codon:yes gene_type:complete
MKTHIYIFCTYVFVLIVLLLVCSIISCSNVKQGGYTTGNKLQDSSPTQAEPEVTEDVVKYIPLPDWQGYDLNPSSSSYKKIYGINKFKDKRIVITFQQVP